MGEREVYLEKLIKSVQLGNSDNIEEICDIVEGQTETLVQLVFHHKGDEISDKVVSKILAGIKNSIDQIDASNASQWIRRYIVKRIYGIYSKNFIHDYAHDIDNLMLSVKDPHVIHKELNHDNELLFQMINTAIDSGEDVNKVCPYLEELSPCQMLIYLLASYAGFHKDEVLKYTGLSAELIQTQITAVKYVLNGIEENELFFEDEEDESDDGIIIEDDSNQDEDDDDEQDDDSSEQKPWDGLVERFKTFQKEDWGLAIIGVIILICFICGSMLLVIRFTADGGHNAAKDIVYPKNPTQIIEQEHIKETQTEKESETEAYTEETSESDQKSNETDVKQTTNATVKGNNQSQTNKQTAGSVNNNQSNQNDTSDQGTDDTTDDVGDDTDQNLDNDEDQNQSETEPVTPEGDNNTGDIDQPSGTDKPEQEEQKPTEPTEATKPVETPTQSQAANGVENNATNNK